MTVGLDAPNIDPEVSAAESARDASDLASWPARAGAFSVDVLLGVAVVAVMALLGYAARDSWLLWAYASAATVIAAAALVNRWLLPALTGWSLGRSLFAIRVQLSGPDGTGVGIGRLILRDLAHLLDTFALCLGWLWPLWDARHRTFADMLLRTEVHVIDAPRRDTRGRAGAVLLAAALISVAAVGLSYGTQFRQDQAIGEARQQISEQGPRIVEQILSYGLDSYQKDFQHALTLVADSYRDQLVKQQQAAAKHPTTNQYFAVSSAVLEPLTVPDRASMLVALRGQRGVDASSLKFMTATVRVDFVRSHDGRWQLSNLAVLKPSPGGGR